MKPYLIVANGNFLVKEIIMAVIPQKIIVALDGAAHKLFHLGIKPQIILGDFDSFDPPSSLDPEIRLVHLPEQNHSDLYKAIDYCDEQAASDITLICAVGGRLDHHEAALRSLRAKYKKHRPFLIHTEQQTLRYAKDESLVFYGKKGDKCSALAFPHGNISSQGLVYEMENYVLEMGFSESICNVLRTDKVSLDVTGEALIMMPPQLSAQRDFMAKSDIERLQMQWRDSVAYSATELTSEKPNSP